METLVAGEREAPAQIPGSQEVTGPVGRPRWVSPAARCCPVYDVGSPSSLAGLRVSQEPKSLNATVGENVTLSCTFQNRNGSRTKVLWFRGSGEDVVLDAKHPFYKGRLHVSRLDEISKGNATVTLCKLDKRDSGLYQCCIEIQNEMTGVGEGTDLRVMRRNQSVTEDRKESKQDTSTELTIYRATIALAGVSIIILVTTLLLRRRTGIYSSFHAHSTCPFFQCSKCTSLPSYWCKGERDPPIYILQSSVHSYTSIHLFQQ
ncbi:uncharacterized protein LOC116822865 [Chelonoidis abingdonii]|uniref:uncharacterized protein LOC116822865 n=1 Tax=Chelonoidis abingdonii TaxID=106734 RepID=UPI0013F23136|nr:uncharacterized protein LOC116822865 [Chelonoidis abingdonii]